MEAASCGSGAIFLVFSFPRSETSVVELDLYPEGTVMIGTGFAHEPVAGIAVVLFSGRTPGAGFL